MLLRKRVEPGTVITHDVDRPECGKQVAATAKFCRNCGASQLEESPSTPPSVVPPLANPPCVSCGTPLGPDEKFCGACGAKEGETQAGGAPRPPLPFVPPHPAPVPPPALTCSSCGQILTPGTRYCGGCGSPKRSPIPAPSPGPVIVSPPSPHAVHSSPRPATFATPRDPGVPVCG